MKLSTRKIIADEISNEIIKNDKIEHIREDIKSLTIMDYIKIIKMVIKIIRNLIKK